jgi:hypothetical protein
VNERPFGHSPGHARHDRLLVARFAVGESLPGEAEEGRLLVSSCTDCGRLAEDLGLLRTSLAAMPAPLRTRNFRLTPEQAERLRGNAIERFLRGLAAPGLTMLRPVAGVALAMGLTVAVVGAALPLTGSSGAASAPEPPTRTLVDRATAAATATPPAAVGPMADSAAPTSGAGAAGSPETAASPESTKGEVYAAASPIPSATGDNKIRQAPDYTASTNPFAPIGESPPSAPASDTSVDTTRLLLIYGGVTLAMLSFGLLLLAWFARRRLEDPLLR